MDSKMVEGRRDLFTTQLSQLSLMNDSNESYNLDKIIPTQHIPTSAANGDNDDNFISSTSSSDDDGDCNGDQERGTESYGCNANNFSCNNDDEVIANRSQRDDSEVVAVDQKQLPSQRLRIRTKVNSRKTDVIVTPSISEENELTATSSEHRQSKQTIVSRRATLQHSEILGDHYAQRRQRNVITPSNESGDCQQREDHESIWRPSATGFSFDDMRSDHSSYSNSAARSSSKRIVCLWKATTTKQPKKNDSHTLAVQRTMSLDEPSSGKLSSHNPALKKSKSLDESVNSTSQLLLKDFERQYEDKNDSTLFFDQSVQIISLAPPLLDQDACTVKEESSFVAPGKNQPKSRRHKFRSVTRKCKSVVKEFLGKKVAREPQPIYGHTDIASKEMDCNNLLENNAALEVSDEDSFSGEKYNPASDIQLHGQKEEGSDTIFECAPIRHENVDVAQSDCDNATDATGSTRANQKEGTGVDGIKSFQENGFDHHDTLASQASGVIPVDIEVSDGGINRGQHYDEIFHSNRNNISLINSIDSGASDAEQPKESTTPFVNCDFSELDESSASDSSISFNSPTCSDFKTYLFDSPKEVSRQELPFVTPPTNAGTQLLAGTVCVEKCPYEHSPHSHLELDIFTMQQQQRQETTVRGFGDTEELDTYSM